MSDHTYLLQVDDPLTLSNVDTSDVSILVFKKTRVTTIIYAAVTTLKS